MRSSGGQVGASRASVSGAPFERRATPTSTRTRRRRSFPAIPAPPGHHGAPGVHAALDFLDGAASTWTVADLTDWIDEHVVAPGLLKRPHILREPGATPIVLDGRGEPRASVEEILTKARARVTTAIRGLVGPVTDDRFLHAAIYGGRVRRTTIDGRPAWTPSPREIDFLSDTVLSLLAADVLADRDFYRTHLCFCDVCSRVAYKEASDARAACPEHRTGRSGFIPRVG